MGKLADADLEFRPIAKTPQTRPTAELGELLARTSNSAAFPGCL